MEQSEWMKKFDKRFDFELHGFDNSTVSLATFNDEIKSFITSLLASEKKALLEEIIKEVPEKKNKHDNIWIEETGERDILDCSYDEAMCWSAGRSAVLSLIEAKKKEA
jgi:hypothetical protein